MQRFIEAQEDTWETAYLEIKRGKKKTHWMWFIFPQIKGLGVSGMSKYYAIQSMDEAKEYLNHPILGSRLKLITEAVLDLPTRDAVKVFGTIDSFKLRSCMTLFALADKDNDSVFEKVLERYFNGRMDRDTLTILGIKQ